MAQRDCFGTRSSDIFGRAIARPYRMTATP